MEKGWIMGGISLWKVAGRMKRASKEKLNLIVDVLYKIY